MVVSLFLISAEAGDLNWILIITVSADASGCCVHSKGDPCFFTGQVHSSCTAAELLDKHPGSTCQLAKHQGAVVKQGEISAFITARDLCKEQLLQVIQRERRGSKEKEQTENSLIHRIA